MGEIVNLNKVRKARAKTDAKATAANNRGLNGVTKAQKDLAAKIREKVARKLDQTRREPPTS